MIATSNLQAGTFQIPRSLRQDVGVLHSLRESASREVERAFDGVSGKRINGALVPGITRHSITRASNGCESNPLWRLAGWFVLARRLGIPKARVQRLIDWLQAQLDAAYADDTPPSLEEVMDAEHELDTEEDKPQQRAYAGDRDALHRWLDLLLARHALDRTVIAAVSARLWF